MKDRLFVLLLLSMGIFFVGCNTDTQGEESLKTQQMWDNGEYEEIIESLESKKIRTAQENMRLGNAYMNAADLSFTDLAYMISESSSRSIKREASNDSYLVFAQKIEKKIENNPEVLDYLEKAVSSFSLVDDNTSMDENNVSISTLIGATQTAQATSAFSYLGDISQLFENGIDYELIASACAIYHIYGYPEVETLDNPIDNCLQSRVINDFNSSKSYKEMIITLDDGKNYTRLLTLDMKNIILTDGYYDENRNNPKMVEDESLTIENALIKSLNEGFSTIVMMLDEEIRDKVLVFRDEIDLDKDGVISELELSNFIQAQVQK